MDGRPGLFLFVFSPHPRLYLRHAPPCPPHLALAQGLMLHQPCAELQASAWESTPPQAAPAAPPAPTTEALARPASSGRPQQAWPSPPGPQRRQAHQYLWPPHPMAWPTFGHAVKRKMRAWDAETEGVRC